MESVGEGRDKGGINVGEEGRVEGGGNQGRHCLEDYYLEHSLSFPLAFYTVQP